MEDLKKLTMVEMIARWVESEFKAEFKDETGMVLKSTRWNDEGLVLCWKGDRNLPFQVCSQISEDEYCIEISTEVENKHTKEELLIQAGRMANALEHVLNKKVCEIGYGNLMEVLQMELDKYNSMIIENVNND